METFKHTCRELFDVEFCKRLDALRERLEQDQQRVAALLERIAKNRKS